MSDTFEWCQDKTRLKTFNKQVSQTSIYGTKRWYLNGKHHRENGPAIERANGDKWWCFNGQLHRENGPAFETANGYKEWWLNDRHYSESDYWEELNK